MRNLRKTPRKNTIFGDDSPNLMPKRKFTNPCLSMLVKYNILLFVIVLCWIGCKNPSRKLTQQESLPAIDTLLEIAGKKGTGYAVNSLKFLDSATAGKKFTIKEKVRLYGYKEYMYNNYANNLDSAQLFADSMLLILQNKNQEKYKEEFANAYFANGDILFRKKMYTESYAFYYKARQISNVYFDSCTLSEYSYRIGLILYRQSRFLESKNNFIQSFNESQACDSLDFTKYFRKQELLNAIALCYLKTGNADSADYYFNRTLEFIDQHKSNFTDRAALHEIAKGVVYGNLGDVLRVKGNLVSAAEMFKKSIAINLKPGYDIKDAQLSYLKLSDLWFAENKFDSAYNALLAIKKSLDSTANPRAVVDWNKQMWRYFDHQKNSTLAYIYLNNYIQKNEAYLNSTKSINEVDVDKQIAFFEKQNELQKLQNVSELNKWYFLTFIVVVVLVVAISILFWYSWNKSKKNIQQLQQLNTTIHAQNEQLEVALEKLEESSKEKDRIVKMVAHDLRTPVASIMSLADLVNEEKNESAKKEMLDIIKQACTNSLTLISEILVAARTDVDELTKEKVNANYFIHECVSLLQIKATEKNQKVVVDLPKQTVHVLINKEKFTRVINNLVTNSIKFSHAGSIITIALATKQQNNKAIITINDTGIGIPNNLKDKVFDILTDAKRFGTNGEQPFGLGLSITKQIVEAHGGKIWFESKVNAGTSFYIELPAVD